MLRFTLKLVVCLYLEFNTFEYDSKFIEKSSSCLQYDSDKYGLVVCFLKSKSKHHIVVKKLKEKVNASFCRNLHRIALKHIDRFFSIVKVSNELLLIEFSSSIKKAILMKFDDDSYIVTPLNGDEHN
jgi:hypothetical protein